MRLANARRVPRRWRFYDLAYRGRRLSRRSAVGLQVKTRRSGYARSVSHPRHPGRIHGQHLPPITEPRVQHGEPAHEQADQVGLISPGHIHVNDDIGRRLRLQKGGDIFRNVRRRVTARGKGYAMEALRKEIRLRFATPVVPPTSYMQPAGGPRPACSQNSCTPSAANLFIIRRPSGGRRYFHRP